MIEVEASDFLRKRGKHGRLGPWLLPLKNELYKIVRRVVRLKSGAKKKVPKPQLTPRHRFFRSRMKVACRGVEASAWAYRLDASIVTSQTREVAGLLFPSPDNDSCLAGIKDAIEGAGVLLNDAQVVDDRIHSSIGDEPSMRIVLEHVPEWGETRV